MSIKGPRLLAHRGWASRYPENTCLGLEAALRAGVPAVEFDIQLSADAVPVVIHDTTLMRTAAVAGNVQSSSASELTAVSVHEPARFGPQFAGTPLPSLADVVDLLERWPSALAFAEIKPESARRHGIDATVARVLEVLHPIADRTVVISFVQDVVASARSQGARTIGWVLSRYDDATRAAAETLAPEYLVCDHHKFPSEPHTLWSGPWHWVSYEIADVSQALALVARGVGTIESFAAGDLAGDPRLGSGNAPGHPP